MAISVALEGLPDRLIHVAVRKNGLDADSPRLDKWYFKHVYLPFLRFSAKYFHIPPPNRLEPDGSFTFLEPIGLATDKVYAASMVEEGANYRLKTLPVNAALPTESVDWEPDTWPNADKPDRYHHISVARMKAVPVVPCQCQSNGNGNGNGHSKLAAADIRAAVGLLSDEIRQIKATARAAGRIDT